MADAQDQPVVEDGAEGQADEVGRRHHANGGRRFAGGVQAQGGQEDMKPLPRAMMNRPSRGASAIASKRGDIRTSGWNEPSCAFCAACTECDLGKGQPLDLKEAGRGRLSLWHMRDVAKGADAVLAGGCHRMGDGRKGGGILRAVADLPRGRWLRREAAGREYVLSTRLPQKAYMIISINNVF
jgi:hypothetical protein